MINYNNHELPIEWETIKLAQVVSFLDHKRVPIKEEDRQSRSGEFPYYGASGIIDYVDDYIFDEDLILLAEDGANILARSTPIAFKAIGKYWVNNHAHVLKPKLNSDIDYLIYYLESLSYHKFNSGAAQPKLNREVCNSIPVVCPPLCEQKAIADLLSTCDEAIEKIERLIQAKEKWFKWLLNKMISSSTFKRGHIKNFTKEVSVRNKRKDIGRVLSVTNRNGFVLPEEQFARTVASDDLSNYKVVLRGQYAYNPSRINVGSIARLNDWDQGVLSPMYIVFSIDESMINSDFFLLWLSSHEAQQRIAKSAQGSVRETVSFSDLGNIPFPIPDLLEQIRISVALNAVQHEIDLLKQLAEKYKTQKCGLMQKMLTGQWRVKSEIVNQYKEV